MQNENSIVNFFKAHEIETEYVILNDMISYGGFFIPLQDNI